LRSAKNGGTGRDWVSGVTTLNVTLAKTSSGGDGGGGATPPPAQIYDFTVYAKNGASAAPVMLKSFRNSELADIATKNTKYAYLYAQNNAWRAVVATELIPLDSMLSAAGAGGYWKSGSYLEFTCTDGVYDKSYPYYENIRECAYYFSGASASPVAVPAGFALSWNSGSADNIDAIASSAYNSGHPRFVYGISQTQYDNMNAAGARSPSGVISVTIVYNASSVPGGSVGTEHPAANADADKTDEEEKAETTAQTGTPVAAVITVKAVTEADKQEVVAAFADVSDSWYTEAVAFAVKNELFTGVSDTEFAPNATMTRAMLITVLARAAGVDTTEGENWYSTAVDWAKQVGISDGSALSDNITREQIATMLYRFAGEPTVIGGIDATDASGVSNWARSAMLWATQQGIIKGYDDGSIRPDVTATRVEVATMIQRWLESQ
jgi:hypothetical protein